MLGISPGLGVWFGWPFAIMGLAGLIRTLGRSRPEGSELSAKLYWAIGMVGIAGAFWATGSAALNYGRQWEGGQTPRLAELFETVAEPMAFSICSGFLVMGMTAMSHRLSERACLPLGLYWGSFVPFTLLLQHLLLMGFELAGLY